MPGPARGYEKCIPAGALANDKEYVRKEEVDHEEAVQSLHITPSWVTRMAFGADEHKMNQVQEAIIADFSKNLFVAEHKCQRYSEVSKYFFKFLSIAMSKSEYAFMASFLPAPSSRLLKEMRCCVLLDIEVTARNFFLAKEYFLETVS